MKQLNSPSLFKYASREMGADHTLFTLHGTGGQKEDFLFLADRLGGQYNVVGLEGNVDEQGSRRFFKRHAEGVFDLDSLHQESGKLQNFIQEWGDTYQIPVAQLVFLGYSNGANMLLASLFEQPALFRQLVLLHPMLPFQPSPALRLAGIRILVAHGVNDPMVSADQQYQLNRLLEQAGADLTCHFFDAGHRISEAEISKTTTFLRSLF